MGFSEGQISNTCCLHLYVNNSLFLAWNHARMFVCRHYLFQDIKNFPRAKLKENCELWGTDDVLGQIYKHIFVQNKGYWVYYHSNILQHACLLISCYISTGKPEVWHPSSIIRDRQWVRHLHSLCWNNDHGVWCSV